MLSCLGCYEGLELPAAVWKPWHPQLRLVLLLQHGCCCCAEAVWLVVPRRLQVWPRPELPPPLPLPPAAAVYTLVLACQVGCCCVGVRVPAVLVCLVLLPA